MLHVRPMPMASLWICQTATAQWWASAAACCQVGADFHLHACLLCVLSLLGVLQAAGQDVEERRAG